jgi:hypothetical protein
MMRPKGARPPLKMQKPRDKEHPLRLARNPLRLPTYARGMAHACADGVSAKATTSVRFKALLRLF